MKIRNGFVSNSSSSSFIVKNKKMTTAQVATIMLYGVRKNRIEYARLYPNERDTSHIYCMDDAIKWLEINQEFDKPIVFPWTTNFETFIWRSEKKGICVSTCNNQEEYWGMLGELYHVDDMELPSTDGQFLDLDSMETFEEHEYRDYRWQKIMGNLRRPAQKISV